MLLSAPGNLPAEQQGKPLLLPLPVRCPEQEAGDCRPPDDSLRLRLVRHMPDGIAVVPAGHKANRLDRIASGTSLSAQPFRAT